MAMKKFNPTSPARRQMTDVYKRQVMNPTLEQRQKSDLALTVASTHDKVAMIEAGANEVSDDVMYDAIMKAHEQNAVSYTHLDVYKRQL